MATHSAEGPGLPELEIDPTSVILARRSPPFEPSSCSDLSLSGLQRTETHYIHVLPLNLNQLTYRGAGRLTDDRQMP